MGKKSEVPSWVENAKQEAKDRENQPKIDEAYEKSRTSLKKGGTASARADGIASKGKTRGTMVTMCGGGKAKR